MTGTNFLLAANALGELSSRGTAAITALDQTAPLIASLNTAPNQFNDVAVLNRVIIAAAFTINSKHVKITPPLKDAVVSLTKLALIGFQTIDAYLGFYSVKVTADYAALSSLCGYSIAFSNIAS